MTKTITSVILFFVFFFVNNLTLQAYKPSKSGKVTTVVIDAGHGGHDSGAVGKKSKEKDIALDLALRLGKLIEKNFSDVKVIYTRKTDEFIELYRRAQIANEIHADLFICIHCNSNKSASPNGSETYVMGLDKSNANIGVAKKENGVILLEKDYTTKYDGYDPNSVEANIIFSLFQNAHLDQSLDFAAKVQKYFSKNNKSFNRGVKQAGFLVLWKTTMPSVLIETGFISNAKEEEYLTSEKGKNQIAKSILSAFKEYKFKVEGFNNQSKVTDNNSEDIEEDVEETIVAVDVPKVDTTHPKNIFTKTTDIKPAKDTLEQDITFRIQFASSSVEKPLNAPEFANFKNVKRYFHNGMYKYTVGNEKTLKEANDLLLKLHEKGYKDAFIVAFLNEQRISPAEAVKLLKK